MTPMIIAICIDSEWYEQAISDHIWTMTDLRDILFFSHILLFIYHDAKAIYLALDIGRSSNHLQKARYTP